MSNYNNPTGSKRIESHVNDDDDDHDDHDDHDDN